jgi:dCTP deaminase
MSFLSGIKIKKEIRARIISFESLVGEYPFDLNKQVTEESVDLRLFPLALRIKSDVQQIDFLNDQLDELYEEITLSQTDGYVLKPNQMILGQTLEAISLPAHYVGFMFGRTIYSQIGIMITCGAPKMSSGLHWAFALQITNCGSTPVKLYPYSIIAQFLISTIDGEPIRYPSSGRLQKNFKPKVFGMNEREKSFLKSLTAESINRIEHISALETELSSAKEAKSKSLGSWKKKGNLFARVCLASFAALAFGYSVNLLPTGALIAVCILIYLIFTYFTYQLKSSTDNSQNE